MRHVAFALLMVALSVPAYAEDVGDGQQEVHSDDQIADALVLQDLKIKSSRADLVKNQEEILALQQEAAMMNGQNGLQWSAIATLGTVSAAQTVAVEKQAVRIDLEAARNDEQDTALAAVEERVESNDQKDAQQDQALESVTKAVTKAAPKSAQDNAQNARLDIQQSRLDQHAVDIGEIQDDLRDHDARLSVHDAMLSDHARQLGELHEGVAMAMALGGLDLDYPSDLARYVVGIQWSDYEGTSAFAVGGKMRINHQLSANVRAASDAGFKQSGVSAGVSYGW